MMDITLIKLNANKKIHGFLCFHIKDDGKDCKDIVEIEFQSVIFYILGYFLNSLGMMLKICMYNVFHLRFFVQGRLMQ